MAFKDKYGPWALITGASEGTGSAFAHNLAKQGFNLILIARREGPLAELGKAIRATGVECVTASVDLSSLHLMAFTASKRALLTDSGKSPPPSALKLMTLAWMASRSSVRSVTWVT